MGGKPKHEVISAVGSAVPLFQTFLAFMAAAVPYHYARLVLTAMVLSALGAEAGQGISQ